MATDAYENTVELAREAERLGYSRFWVAEHHGFSDPTASTTPEVLIAHLAAKTDNVHAPTSSAHRVRTAATR